MKDEIGEKDLELLSACLDGECGDPDALRARLNAEPELALRLRQLQAVRARLAALPSPNPPADFAERVAKRAYARKLPVFARKFWWYTLPVAAAAAVLLLVVAGPNHKTTQQTVTAPDHDAWQIALNGLADSPDAEAMAEWVDPEPVLDEPLPNDLVRALADLSTGEPGGGEEAENSGVDTDASIIDLMGQMDDVDAAVLAARLKSGA
jgi:negative regulator of sigma E activity